MKRTFGKDVKVLWHDRKRYWGLPISFTQYSLVEKEGEWIKFIVETGLLYTKIDEFHLYKVDDVSVYESLVSKLFGVGNIDIYVNDNTTSKLRAVRVKNPYKVYDLLNTLVQKDKATRKVIWTESNIQR